MKTLNSNLKTVKNNKLMWDDEELVDQRDYRLNGKKMDRKRPVQNWTKAWSEHLEDFDEVDDFYEH
jgi:hypothetical protein